ncbi:MAG: anthranilate phosphoribosyltransferase [Gammaproteobacteria bacterium]
MIEDNVAEATMSAYIKRIATGPKMSKDLTLADARNGMELILTGAVDPVQAAIFLIALRMKRESDDENFGILEALRAHTLFSVAEVDELIDIGDPYDGFLRHLPAGPFLPALLAACGVSAVSHGCQQLGPKFGLTHHQVLAAAGIKVNLAPQEAAACISNPRIGWAYIDQRHFNPALHALTELRRLIVKRPCLATLEKLCGPLRAREKNHLVVGYVHAAYEQLLPQLARHAVYNSALVLRGIEGGIVAPLNAPSKLSGYTRDGLDVSEKLSPHEAGIDSKLRNTSLPDALDNEIFDHGLIAATAAQAGLAALNGASGPMRDSLVLAAAAILQHIGRAKSLNAAAALARDALDSGSARERFKLFPHH